nr:AMP-activated protein kinase beta 2 [Cryptomonas sp.]
MKKWKHFDNKICGRGDLEYDIKIKDISNSFKGELNLQPNFIRYILPIDQDISVPTVFNWNLGGTSVNVSGDWDNWSHEIPLSRSGNEFTTIIPLSPGHFQYKFIVDGNLKYANNHKLKKDVSGHTYNITNIQNFERNLELQDSFSDNENLANFETSKTSTVFVEDNKRDPPIVPLYLADLFETNLTNKDIFYYRSFLKLPTQVHVFLNHLFFLSCKKVTGKLKQILPALRARINGKTINVIFCSRIKESEFQEIHPLKEFF